MRAKVYFQCSARERERSAAGGRLCRPGGSHTQKTVGQSSAMPARSTYELRPRRRGGGSVGEPGVPPRASGSPALCDVLQILSVRQRAELLQALVFDLADAFARDLERASDLVERSRMLAVQAVPHLQHAALTRRQRPEDL